MQWKHFLNHAVYLLYLRSIIIFTDIGRTSSGSQASGLARIWLARKNADGTSCSTDNEQAATDSQIHDPNAATTPMTNLPAGATDRTTSGSSTTIATATVEVNPVGSAPGTVVNPLPTREQQQAPESTGQLPQPPSTLPASVAQF